MSLTTEVRVFLREDGQPLKGVRVALFDQDRFSKDDLIGEAVTDAAGRARFRYDPKRFADLGGRFDDGAALLVQENLPDLYVVLQDAKRKPVLSTRASVRRNTLLPQISVPLSLAQARQFGFVGRKKRRTPEQKQRDWISRWQKRFDSEPEPGPKVDLCLTRVVLDAIASIDNPKTNGQKRVAKLLKGRVSAQDRKKVIGFAEKARKTIDDSGLLQNAPCAGDKGLEEMTRILFSPDGPGGDLFRSFTDTAPDPEQNLGSAQRGLGFPEDAPWNKDCSADYEHGGLSPEAKADMDRFWPNEPQVLRKPSINLVDVWDPAYQNYVRMAKVADKQLIVQELDPRQGWTPGLVEMDVELDDPTCLVLQEDGSGQQALVVDVQPGQKVRLLGSGFVSERTRVRARFRRCGIDDQGRLAPDTAEFGVAGFDGTSLDVHGSSNPPGPGQTPQTFNDDAIVFTWPDAASEKGLYRLDFEFENQSDYFTEAEQNESDCRLRTNKDPVSAQPLFFCVLPPVDPQRVRIVATQVECVDETNPEETLFINLADDVDYIVQDALTRLRFDEQQGEMADEAVEDNTEQAARLFWNDGVVWQTGLQAYPADGAARFLQMEEMASIMLQAFEVEGEIDRAIVRATLTIALVVIVVAVILVMIAVIVGLVIAEVITLGLATALLPIIGTIAAFLCGAAFTAGMAAIEAIVSSISGAELIGDVATIFTGWEVAHRLSPLRFHRILISDERPPIGSATTNTTRTESVVSGSSIREVYRSTALGGDYRFTLVCDRP